MQSEATRGVLIIVVGTIASLVDVVLHCGSTDVPTTTLSDLLFAVVPTVWYAAAARASPPLRLTQVLPHRRVLLWRGISLMDIVTKSKGLPD